MDNVITIISVVASILSIIGFILSIKCKDSIINKICYILIIILTVATSYLYTQYKHVTDEQLSIERRKQEIKHEEKKNLKKMYYIKSIKRIMRMTYQREENNLN